MKSETKYVEKLIRNKTLRKRCDIDSDGEKPCDSHEFLRLPHRISIRKSLNNQQKSLVQHKIATFRLKMLISKEYKEFWLENTFTPRLDIKKLIFSQFKKYYIKLNYFLKDSISKNIS